MKALEDQALEDESGYQEDEVIHIHFYELTLTNTISNMLLRSCLYRILHVSKCIKENITLLN